MSDFISLDLEPKMSGTPSPTAVIFKDLSHSTVWYRTNIFKAIAVISFLCVMAFPQPDWLQNLLQHPVGGLIFAWGISVALLPEIEWWIVGLGVLSGYIVISVSGLIESNIDSKRQRIEQETEKIEKGKKAEQDETEEYQHPQMDMDMDMGPMASNGF